MKRNILVIILLIFIVQLSYFFWHPKFIKTEKEALPPLVLNNLPESMRGLNLKLGKFSYLFGWTNKNAEIKKSLQVFLVSCNTFLKQDPNTFVGSSYISLKAKDWYPACEAATKVNPNSEEAARGFFERWFVPVEFNRDRPLRGLFTGYYVPSIQGSLIKTEEYSVPIYALPKGVITVNLRQFSVTLPNKKIIGRVSGNKLVPFYTREEISNGAIDADTNVLAWVNNDIDRLIIETEGSGIIDLGDDKTLAIGYAGTNGAQYRSIASILVQAKLFSINDASMDNIKKYFQQYPDKLKNIINKNKSFVFFRKLPKNQVIGSQGVPLTAGYSMAVDRAWIPMGVPLWLTTTIYDPKVSKKVYFDRLMIAQDAGGSIKGIVRGDIYWGEGENAKNIALKIKNSGHYWLLLPKVRAK